MNARSLSALASDLGHSFSRRATLRRFIAGGGAAVLAGRGAGHVAAQEATAASGECVATAPPVQDGIGVAPLLAGGIIHDMPAGPVAVSISRFTLDPGAGVPLAAFPYPALMYIETGESTCPGNAGKIMYGADGAVLYETTGEAAGHVCPAGTTWYIPAGIEDAADNEGTELMSSLVIEFVPVEADATPPA